MIPLLHDSENINNTYGRGKLSGVISCKIHDVLNGEYELELRYPVTGPMYGELLKGGTVQCMGATVGDLFDKRPEWFDIYKHSLPIDGVVTFYASHISRRLNRRVVTGPLYSRHAGYVVSQSYPSGDLGTVRIEFRNYESQSLPDQSVPISPKSSLAALIGEEDSIISLFGGDMTFYCGFAWNGTSFIEFLDVEWNVAGRGSDKGAQVRYGYNMTNIDHTKDDSETFNAVVPYWDDGNGTRTYVSGYVVQPTTPITPVKAVPMDCTDAFDTQPTGAQIAEYAQNWLDANMPWLGTETLTVDFVNGIEFDPHSPQFDLGDTVHVYWGDAQVAAELRIVEYEFDVLSESFTKLKLGKQQENFVSVTGIDGGSGGSSGGGAIGGTTLLWTNPSPTATFAAQSISIDMSSYKAAIIEFNYTDTSYGYSVIAVKDGLPMQANCITNITSASMGNIVYRTAQMTSSAIVISDCYRKAFNATTVGTVDNTRMIPQRVYGIM